MGGGEGKKGEVGFYCYSVMVGGLLSVLFGYSRVFVGFRGCCTVVMFRAWQEAVPLCVVCKFIISRIPLCPRFAKHLCFCSGVDDNCGEDGSVACTPMVFAVMASTSTHRHNLSRSGLLLIINIRIGASVNAVGCRQ
ncbi:hypothetical protein Dimus_003381 [Dionaea muscipula]